MHVFGPRIPDEERVAHKFHIEIHPFRLWTMGRYAPLRNLKYLFYPFFLERLVLDRARENPYDLIFAQHTISAVAAGRLRSRLKTPVILNFLDYLTAFMETWPPYLAPAFLVRKLTAFELRLPSRYQAEGILTVSDALADKFADAGFPRTRILPIHYGYDSTIFHPPANYSKVAGSPPVIAMHGSFDSHHLGPIIRGAMEWIAREKPGTCFRFIGNITPTLKRLLHDTRSLKSKLTIDCTGFVAYEKIPDLLKDASVGIIPYEASNGTHCAFVAKAVEYLGMGIPVVSTPLNGLQRFFENEPLLHFSEFNGASFGREILNAMHQHPKNFEQARKQTAERVRKQLDWQGICARALDFVEDLPRGYPEA